MHLTERELRMEFLAAGLLLRHPNKAVYYPKNLFFVDYNVNYLCVPFELITFLWFYVRVSIILYRRANVTVYQILVRAI